MKLFEGQEALPDGFGPSAVTIGKFDGVHLGHRGVLAQLAALAAERDLAPVVVTFDRNPLELLAPERCPPALVSNAQRAELLAGAGIAATLELRFDRELSSQPAVEFVESVLLRGLGARLVLAGADFRFGAKGGGDVALLREIGAERGFEVVLIEDVRLGDVRVSSTAIRELLGAGRVREAAVLLGRAHRIRSTVVHGDHIGRELGFPTANLDPAIEGFLPADGVYAAWAVVQGTRYGAAVSVGNNPTFDGVPDRQVEAHLMNQKLDLYGSEIELEFIDRIRPMEKFPSVATLVEALAADVARIREVLAAEPAPDGNTPRQ